METRANYVLVGLFTLAVILGGFGFVYWFNAIGGSADRTTYRIVFEGSVSGLRTGASVLFNGIRVGEVTELKLDPAKPRDVVAMVSIEKAIAVRADTFVSLEFQGVTGTASIALRGGSQDAPLPPGTPPTLTVDTAGAQDVTQAAREAMRRIDQLVHDLVEHSEAAGDIVQGEVIGGAMSELRAFMFERVYLGPVATREHVKINRVIDVLFAHYCDHPEEIPASLPDGDLSTRVTDYLAGMTDRFCIRAFEQLSVPDSFAQ